MLTLEEFAIERMRIFQARVDGTYDGVSPIAHARYTNVHRILDRQSQHMLNVLQQYSAHQCSLVYVATAALLNSAAVTASLPLDVTAPQALAWLQARLRRGQQLRGNAYILTSSMTTEALLAHFLHALPSLELLLCTAPSVAQRYVQLRKVPGFGPFLAYQMALTFSYMGPCVDYDTFVIPGAGALRGLRFVKGQTFDQNSGGAYIARQVQDWQQRGLCTWRGTTSTGRQVTLQLRGNDLQNVYCEYAKYRKLLMNPRARHRIYVYAGRALPAPIIPESFTANN